MNLNGQHSSNAASTLQRWIARQRQEKSEQSETTKCIWETQWQVKDSCSSRVSMCNDKEDLLLYVIFQQLYSLFNRAVHSLVSRETHNKKECLGSNVQIMY